MKKFNFDTLDVNNPAPRCPLCIIADVSGSMEDNNGIQELHKGVCHLIEELKADEMSRYCVELEIILFADEAKKILSFTPIADIDEMPPPFASSGATAPGEALQMAHDDILARQAAYRQANIQSYVPYVFLLGDGDFNSGDWKTPGAKLRHLAEKGCLCFYGIEVGDIGSTGHRQFCELVPECPGPARMRDVGSFMAFFDWVWKTISHVTQSEVGMERTLALPSPMGWIDTGKEAY